MAATVSCTSVCSTPGVGQPHRQVGAAFTGGDDGSPLEVLEPHVPQPRQVLAVGNLPVDRDDDAGAVLVDHRQRLLPAGRVLGQQDPRGVRPIVTVR